LEAGRLLEKQPVAAEAVSTDGQVRPTTANTHMLHALYVAAHATSVALTGYERGLQDRLEVGARRRQPLVERPTLLEVELVGGMIARFDAIEQLAAASLAARRIEAADQPATGRRRPATRLGVALAVWEVQAYRTLANQPDPADLVRVSRVQALIATTTVVVGEAAARLGGTDAGVIDRLTPALENVQLAWSRSARRWAELTTPASRTDPALVGAAGQLRVAIRGAVANQTGWATPDQIAARIDLPATVMTLHGSLLASVELANITREIAADHPGLAAPARVIAMRAQGEAEFAIEQGETRFEGVRWVTPDQITANQVIPLPEPARRGLVNAATDVAAAINQAVAAAAHLRPTARAPRVGVDGARRVGRAAREREISVHVIGQYSDAVSSGERHILALVEALALGRPLEDVGGLMASLDPYHLGLVLAVLRHAGCGSGSARNSSEDSAGECL
jgi:hypothetical protein